MFYDNFVSYCNSVSKSPSAVASELGLSRASVNGWKNGKIPTDANQIKIAQYFGVSVTDLMSEQKEKPAQAQAETSEFDGAFFRLKKGLEPLGLNDDDADFLLDVYKAHKKRNR